MKMSNIGNMNFTSRYNACSKQVRYLYDVMCLQRPPKSSIKEIANVHAGLTGGTVCEGSKSLPDFFERFSSKKIKELIKIGQSTNADGFPHSFLKAKSDVPVSTSFVHDCSALYLYNSKTKTHALYHAQPDIPKEELDDVIKSLMPEGFTHGTIIPGGAEFSEIHKYNMGNMFDLMKRNNPESIVSVRHYSSYFPEIVGYKGAVYQIPNKKIAENVKKHPFLAKMMHLIEDKGQASFKVLELEGFNTFDKVNYGLNSLDDVERITIEFKKKNYSKEVFALLQNYIERRVELLKKVKTMSIVELVKAKQTGRIEDYHIYDNQLKVLDLTL